MPIPAGPPLDTAGVVSTVLEGVLYGFSVLMFILTIWILLRRKRMSEVNLPMFIVAIFLFLFSSVHIAIDVKRIHEGLVEYRDTFVGGPIGYFSDVSQKTFVSKSAVYAFQTALGDGVVIYRAYVVWGSLSVIILPVVLWFSLAAASIGTVYTISLANADSGNIFANRTAQWITSFYATTLACNLTATILLASKLWSAERNARRIRASRSTVLPALLIVVDAGVLYSVTLVSALACFASGNRAQYIILDMITPIISISFFMVILRVAMVQADRKNISNNSTVSARQGSSFPQSRRTETLPMAPVQVHISRLTENDVKGTFMQPDDHANSQPGSRHDSDEL